MEYLEKIKRKFIIIILHRNLLRKISFVFFQMQKTEIHWSPNDRNQLAEIGAEIIIHSFDRPLTGESGKCVSGGTNKKTTRLNYPLHEKNNIKVSNFSLKISSFIRC